MSPLVPEELVSLTSKVFPLASFMRTAPLLWISRCPIIPSFRGLSASVSLDAALTSSAKDTFFPGESGLVICSASSTF